MECNRDGYACFGGTEIWNLCRTLTYVQAMPQNGFFLSVAQDSNGLCCGCCDTTYTSADIDEAPWYNPVFPESAGFYGIMPTDIDGLSYNPTVRAVSQGIGGATFARRYEAGRVIEVTALAYADSCEAMDWGLAWLQSTLERDCGSSGFAWQSCCPASESLESGVESPDDHGLRTIPCVALTEGMSAESFLPETLRGLVYEVTFTITAEQSWIYDAPIEIATEVIWPGDGELCADYNPECIDGAAIEVFIDRARNVGVHDEIVVLANPTRYLGSQPLTISNARYGAVMAARPGDSILLDPRCNLVATVGPTGHILRPHNQVALTHNAQGLFPVAYYGDSWRICVSTENNSSGAVSVTIRAHPRRRF